MFVRECLFAIPRLPAVLSRSLPGPADHYPNGRRGYHLRQMLLVSVGAPMYSELFAARCATASLRLASIVAAIGGLTPVCGATFILWTRRCHVPISI